MKVLVVGGEGQLGSTISELSASCGFAEFRVTRMEELDLSSEKNVKNFMGSVDFDYVVNCAAYTAVDKAETERETARTINALAPGWIARYAKEKGAGIIHISTDYVFGGNANTPLAPDMPTAPSSVYGATKLEGEKLVAEANPRHLIIRTSWLYSRYGNNFVKTMLRLAGEREELSVVYDQVGAPTYADDLAGAILKILEVGSHNDKAFIPGIYHYSNLGVCSWYDFARAIFTFAGRNTRVKPILSAEYKTAATRPSFSVLDSSSIRRTYNIEIPYWTDSLKKCLEAFGEIGC